MNPEQLSKDQRSASGVVRHPAARRIRLLTSSEPGSKKALAGRTAGR